MLNWSDIKGHARIKEVLERSLSQGRLHHALLMAGPDGVGKRAMALALAAAINCRDRVEGTFEPGCGQCNSCRKIFTNIHPDLLVVEPDGKVLKYIKIDQIRALQKSVTTKPYEARERVIILVDAHAMTEEASNALLKTLEEPTQGTRLILTTDQPHRLLETIRSRCQLIRFGALEQADVEQILARAIQDHPDIDASSVSIDLGVAAGFGEGSPGRSLELIATGALDERAELIERLQTLRPRHPMDYLNWAEELGKNNARFSIQLDALKVFLRDVMRYQAGGERAPIINRDMEREVIKWAGALTPNETLDMIKALNEAADLITRNVNKQFIAEKTLRRLRPSEHQSNLLFKH